MSKTLRPDPAQLAVMESRGRLCVVAGAGSGKTGTLVESIALRLEESFRSGKRPASDADRPLDITDILALTFTDKAAAEMRKRLAEAFESRRLAAPDRAEADFWRSQVARLDRADIGTIHSFALKLVRENPLRLGLASPPELEEDGRGLSLDIGELIRDWLDQLPKAGGPSSPKPAAPPQGAELLELLAVYRLPVLQQMLEKCASTMSSWGLSRLTADLRPRRTDFSPAISAFKGLVREALAALASGAAVKPESSYYPRVLNAVSALSRHLESADSAVQAARIEADLPRWKALLDSGGDWHTKPGRALRRGLNEALEAMLDQLDEERALALRQNFIKLVQRLVRDLASARKKRGVMNFDDILILARRLLAQNPDLRRHQAERHRLVIIDEFQDTNRLQADLLAYLLLPAGDDRVFPEDHPIWREIDWRGASENFLVFGDLKQSIYRFRGAEVDIMADLGRDFAAGGGRVMPLNRNYRSQAPLVRFFNALFAQGRGDITGVPAEPENGAAHQEAQARPSGRDITGVPTESKNGAAHQEAQARPSGRGITGASAESKNLDYQLDQRPALYPGPHVVHLCAAPELRPPRQRERGPAEAAILVNYLSDLFQGRLGVMLDYGDEQLGPPRPQDVAVIFRAFTRVATFKEALEEAGWACRLAAGDRPFEYAEVKALLAACQFIWGIDREISLVAALRSPLGPVSDSALTRLARPGDRARPLSDYFLNDRPWPDGLEPEDLAHLDSLKKIFSQLAPLRGRLRPVEIMERLAEERQLLPLAALEADGPDRVRAVTGFLGLSRSAGLSRRGRQLGPVEELGEIRRLWDPRRDGRQNPPSAQALTLMTVHAAKGLEFPVVVVAEADRKNQTRPGPALISADGRLALKFNDPSGRQVKPADYRLLEEEEKRLDAAEDERLLYVAATRARDQLVFLGWPSAKAEGQPSPDQSEPRTGRKTSTKKKDKDGQAEADAASAAPTWLEKVLGRPEAAALVTRLEYEPARRPELEPPAAAAPLPDSPAAPPRLLAPMSLTSWSLSVTDLSRFLADPEGYARDRFLGPALNAAWRPGRPFFPPAPPAAGRKSKGLTPAEAGSLFHAALEHLNPLQPALRDILAGQAEKLGLAPKADELADLAGRLEIFLKHPLGLAWRASQAQGLPVRRELPFTLQINDISASLRRLTLNGVIDLFFQTPDGGGQIVDYKLARPQPGAGLEAYEHQLRIYAQALISNGFSGPLSAALYFAGGDSPLVHPVELDLKLPIQPVLAAVAKKFEKAFHNRPLRPAWPETLNIVYFSIT